MSESIGDHVLTDESDLKNSISKLVPIRKLIERRYNRESPTTMEDISYMDKLIRLAYSMPHVKDMKNKAMNFVDLKSGIRFKKSKEYNIYDKLYQSCCDED
ncbi:unnamed protein product [Oppiella nova]|uniref:Uncharacterized protein n=1 Tax=Oppiella nova TaxID=334625 RepID=A0A7R9QLQ2_9ACAR|nr:unnamed protein product [Oppiella nova]CAG2168461.1 unnamed protein product [Oppiella nova]